MSALTEKMPTNIRYGMHDRKNNTYGKNGTENKIQGWINIKGTCGRYSTDGMKGTGGKDG